MLVPDCPGPMRNDQGVPGLRVLCMLGRVMRRLMKERSPKETRRVKKRRRTRMKRRRMRERWGAFHHDSCLLHCVWL